MHAVKSDRTTEVLMKLATNLDGKGYRPDGTWLSVKQVNWLRGVAYSEKAWRGGNNAGHGAGCGGWFDDGANIVYVDVIVSPINKAGLMNIRIENKAAKAAADLAAKNKADA